MLTWRCTSPPSPRTSPLSPGCARSSSSNSPPTVAAETSTRSRLLVARRNGVGMYTVTAMTVPRFFRSVSPLASAEAPPRLARPRPISPLASAEAPPRLALPLTQVSLARVGQHGNDELVRLELRGDSARGKRGGAGRGSDQQPLLAREAPRPHQRVLVAHLDDPIDDVTVEHARHERRADSLDGVRMRLATGEDGRFRGLHGDQSNARHLLPEHLADPRQRPAGADARDER